jgi:uncharacterized protein GlcG (DUF336 family)
VTSGGRQDQCCRSTPATIGSIGVSGTPGGDKDAICARIGIDRFVRPIGRL